MPGPAFVRTFPSPFTGLAVTLLAWQASAAPCRVPDVPTQALRIALGQAVAPKPVPILEIDRWRAALPVRMSASMHNGWLEGDGWSATSAGPSQRTSSSASLGYAIHLQWDLHGLWARAPLRAGPTTAERLQRALHAEELARRAAAQLQRLRRAQALASQAQDGDYVCQDAQAEAEAAALVLGVMIGEGER